MTQKIDLRLINDDLIRYATKELLYSYEDVASFTYDQWMTVLTKYVS